MNYPSKHLIFENKNDWIEYRELWKDYPDLVKKTNEGFAKDKIKRKENTVSLDYN